MRPHELKKEIDQLALPEKLLLVEDIWDSIAASNRMLPMPEWQKVELDNRYAAYQKGETDLHSWQEVHEALRDTHR